MVNTISVENCNQIVINSKQNSSLNLKNCDCFEYFVGLDDKSIDLIFVDLPFGKTHAEWDIIIPMDKLWIEYNRLLKDDGVVLLFGTEPFSSMLRTSNLKDYRYDWYWVKPNSTTPNLAKVQPMRRLETISVFYKQKPTYNPQFSEGKPYKWASKRSGGAAHGIVYEKDSEINNPGLRYPTNVLEFGQERGLHVSQKPVALLEYLIKTYTNEGENVLDHCFGSCSCGIACANTGRNFYGCENNSEIFNKAVERVKNICEA